ncbi:MAG: NAD-dependent epimerase/dehydratase family protein [Deltaproteobacteria bacterium]|nr:NAD-dependent epimerase/dehydratase family protein [Deltaproteobacteria bacterium]
MKQLDTVLVTGGAGYVGSVLVPKLLQSGYRVRVLDLYIFGQNALDGVKDHPRLEQIKGDIRDQNLLRQNLRGCDAVIHLACISNDPSFELNPVLSRSINYDAFGPLVRIGKESGVRRFVYASTSSVYGVSGAQNVAEDHPLVPITDYNKYKGLCEPILLESQSPDFTTVVIRPATVCGYSPRQRLDLTVNILTNHAVNMGRITIFGGSQMRPNIHIEDVVDLYLMLLYVPDGAIAGKIFNAGYQNYTVAEIAEIVRGIVERDVNHRTRVEIVTTPTDDHRSYHISSEKIKRELGFAPKRTIEDAVCDLVAAFRDGRIPNPMTDIRYYNIKSMQHLGLT